MEMGVGMEIVLMAIQSLPGTEIGGNGNRGDGKMGMGMQYWNGNGNDSMGVGREWEQEVIPAHL